MIVTFYLRVGWKNPAFEQCTVKSIFSAGFILKFRECEYLPHWAVTEGIPYIYILTFSIIIGFMRGAVDVSGACPMRMKGPMRSRPVVCEKGTEDNRENENPISVGDVAANADPKEIFPPPPWVADVVMWISPIPGGWNYG